MLFIAGPRPNWAEITGILQLNDRESCESFARIRFVIKQETRKLWKVVSFYCSFRLRSYGFFLPDTNKDWLIDWLNTNRRSQKLLMLGVVTADQSQACSQTVPNGDSTSGILAIFMHFFLVSANGRDVRLAGSKPSNDRNPLTTGLSLWHRSFSFIFGRTIWLSRNRVVSWHARQTAKEYPI